MKKRYFIVMALFFVIQQANAQDYYHATGLQINYGIFSEKMVGTGENVSTEAAAVPGAFYKASLAFDAGRSSSFVISAYPFIGLSGTLNSGSGLSSGGSIGAELPILGEFYFGDLDDPSFFFGAGFSAAFLGTSGYGSGFILGPQADIGGQFYLQDRLIGLRFAYTYGINSGSSLTTKRSANMLSLGFYYPFGQ